MKLTLARADLARALGQTARIVERRTTIPILSNVLLMTDQEGHLHLTATDLDIEIKTAIPARIDERGGVTVPAAILDGYVRKLPDGAEVGFAADDRKLVVRAGRSRVTLATLNTADFPDISAGDMPCRFTLPGRDLARLFDAVAFAISTEETRYYLNGIYVHAVDDDGPKLRAVATDGHRLGRAEIDAPAGAEGMPGVIVPRKAIAEITRLVTAADEGDVTVALSAAKIQVTSGATRLTSKLIDGTFPDYGRVIPSGNGKIVELATKDLAAAIDRVATVSTERGRAVRFACAAGEPLRLRMHSPDGGEATDEVDCSFVADAIEIGFNARYAGEILGVLGSSRTEIALADPGSPSVWRDPDDATRLYVLMPMRV